MPCQRTQPGGQTFALAGVGLPQQVGGQGNVVKVAAGFAHQLPGIADGQMQHQPGRQ